MKIYFLKRVPKTKYGKVILLNHDLKPHEEATLFCLSEFGFDVETIIPSSIPKSKNPDLLMLGTTWEIKGPRKVNKNTIQNRFHKARKQSGGRAIFDLRKTDGDVEKLEKYILQIFKTSKGMKRIMIIENNNSILDIFK